MRRYKTTMRGDVVSSVWLRPPVQHPLSATEESPHIATPVYEATETVADETEAPVVASRTAIGTQTVNSSRQHLCKRFPGGMQANEREQDTISEMWYALAYGDVIRTGPSLIWQYQRLAKSTHFPQELNLHFPWNVDLIRGLPVCKDFARPWKTRNVCFKTYS